MTTSIQLPNTVESFQLALKKGIEAYSQSPVKKQNKLNESTAIALGLKNKDTLSGLMTSSKPQQIKYSAIIEDNNDIYIDDLLINEELFDEEILKYTVRPREELMDNIFTYLGDNPTPHNRQAMIEDVKYLITLEDEYVFTSIETNKYIALSDNPEKYNELCEDFIFEHHKFESNWEELTEFFNHLKLPNVEFSTDIYFLEDVISNCSEILEKADWDKFQFFIYREHNQYLFKNIVKKQSLQHDAIILLCFLVKYHRHELVSVWDFDTEIIKLIFAEMGFSAEYYNL